MDDTTAGRLSFLALLAAVIGLLGGGVAYVLIHFIGFISNLAELHRIGWSLPSFRHLARTPWIPVVAITGGLVVSVMARWAPLIRGHGIPEAMEAVLTNESRIQLRTAVAKPISAAVAIGTGGPFGAEGPVIVTGGVIGSLIGQVVPVSPSERKILLAAGAAAGMAATFGSPLGAVVLAIELLLFEFSARAFIPLVVASTVAAGVHYSLFGAGPLFPVPQLAYSGLVSLPLYGALGVLCGLGAVVINRGLFVWEKGFRRLPVSEFWYPVIGGLGFAVVGLIMPWTLGVGYDAIGAVLLGKVAVGTLAALAIAKLVAWWIALASGTSGGTVAPLLLIAGCGGSLVGKAAAALFPSLHVSPEAFALVAMAATFGAAIRATFTGIVFVFELTRDYHAILPLMLASVLAELVTTALLRESLMTEKLSRRGLRVASSYRAEVLTTATAEQIMRHSVITLSSSDDIASARQFIISSEHHLFPVTTDDGTCIGTIRRDQILSPLTDPTRRVAEMANPIVQSVAPDNPVGDVVERLLMNDSQHVVVLSEGKVLGICTPADVLGAWKPGIETERPQPGWRPARARRSHPPPDPEEDP